MDLDQHFPSLRYIKQRAKRRLPYFVWEYLDSATGMEATKRRNREKLDEVRFTQGAFEGPFEPDLSTDLLGKQYGLPIGIAPVGMSGLIWPGAEHALAQLGAEKSVPFCLSTAASSTPEDLAGDIGGMGWFQLYPPKDSGIRREMLDRARAAGFHTLVVTIDIPTASRRERQRHSGVQHPPQISPRLVAQAAMAPRWALATLLGGIPTLKLLEEYAENKRSGGPTDHIGYRMRLSVSEDYFSEAVQEWDGPVVVKGVMRPHAALRARELGASAVWISNHGGRQLDGAAAAIEILPQIREEVGADYPLIFDSGVETGLDVLRALALGADFVMAGRAFHYALAAFGAKGAAHMLHIFEDEMRSVMAQIGARDLSELARGLWQPEKLR